MRTSTLIMVFLFSIGMLQAQENLDSIEKGTVLTLGTATPSGYTYIDFPNNNIIIKRGAIAHFNQLEGRKVVVEEVLSKNGKTEVTLRPKDGRNFFRFWPTITAHLEKAMEKGELKLSKA